MMTNEERRRKSEQLHAERDSQDPAHSVLPNTTYASRSECLSRYAASSWYVKVAS